jgi:hypothetical protein
MTAYFIVRALVIETSVKQDFDRWYEVHLKDALKGFKARRAWRGWSAVDANVHYAFYEFEDLARAKAIQGTPALKELVADFDRTWGNKVTRTRDFVEIVQGVS